jgi:hypothetical protein
MLFMTTAGAEMLTKKFGVKIDSHLSKEQLAIARAFRSVQPNMRRNNKNTRSFFVSVPRSENTKTKMAQKIKNNKGIFSEELVVFSATMEAT